MPRTDAPAGPWDRRMMRQEQATEQRPGSMLGRRDVALVPWLVLFAVAATLAVGTVLRGPSGDLDGGLLAFALFSAGIGVAGAVVAKTAFGSRFRATLAIYAGFVTAVLAVLAALAAHDGGLQSVGFAAAIPLAAYAGMVLPLRLSRPLAAAILVVAITIEFLVPDAHVLDAVITVLLIATGWFVGLFANLAHARVARVSRMLASYDPIASVLGRRGFLEQLDFVLSRPATADSSMALLLVDVPEVDRLTSHQGRQAGDRLTAWLGETLPSALPPSAEVGRLDSGQFAILLTGVGVDRAVAVGEAIRATLRPRADATVGVTTSQTLGVAADDLVRIASAALAMARDPDSDRPGVGHLVAGTLRIADPSRVRLRASEDPPLSYAQVRSSGHLPRLPRPGAVYLRMIFNGLVMIASCGAAVIVATFLGDGHTVYDDIIRLFGVPWVLSLVGLMVISRKYGLEVDRFANAVLFVGNTVILSIGVGLAMLAHGGITAPIAGALYLKVLFDGAVTPRRRGLTTLAIVTLGWMVVALLGPGSALWAAPLGLALLGCSYLVGVVGNRAFADVARYSRSLAGIDPLTHAANRRTFDEVTAAAIIDARDAGAALTVLSIDIDGLGRVNHQDGHAAGDERLRDVARALDDLYPDALSVARVGGDEFAVALRPQDARTADRFVEETRAALAPITPVSIGSAGLPADGDDLDALLLCASHRRGDDRATRRPQRLDSAA